MYQKDKGNSSLNATNVQLFSSNEAVLYIMRPMVVQNNNVVWSYLKKAALHFASLLYLPDLGFGGIQSVHVHIFYIEIRAIRQLG